jgi:hypothetical protein
LSRRASKALLLASALAFPGLSFAQGTGLPRPGPPPLKAPLFACAPPLLYCTPTFVTAPINGGFSTSNVDMSNTQASGFQWYFYNGVGRTPNTGTTTINADKSITIGNGPSSPSPQDATLSSAVEITGSPYFKGTAFGCGFDLQIKFRFPATSQTITNWWPGYFFQGLYSFYHDQVTSPGIQWPGQTAGYYHFPEMDGFQNYLGNDGEAVTQFDTTEKDWWGASTCTGSAFCQIDSDFTVSPNFGQTDYSVYQTYDLLYVPSTGSSSGYVKWYLNGALQFTSQPWTQFATTSCQGSSTQCPPSAIAASGSASGGTLTLTALTGSTLPAVGAQITASSGNNFSGINGNLTVTGITTAWNGATGVYTVTPTTGFSGAMLITNPWTYGIVDTTPLVLNLSGAAVALTTFESVVVFQNPATAFNVTH